MPKTREILRLHWSSGLGQREIARSLGISHSTVQDHLMRASAAGLSWPLPEDMTDDVLKQLLFPRRVASQKDGTSLDFAHIHRELKRKGVTMQLLWVEYKRDNPDGYQYSRFCELYQKWRGDIDVSMRQRHKAGEKLFVDWAGQTVPIVDRKTGEARPAYLFVAVLGASNYTYAEASLSQDLPSWISAHCRALEFLGGVPHLIVPDNAKTAVNKPNYYEPELNVTYQEMAFHYSTIILPTRPRKPKDKAKVEIGVQIAERWILAPLRNRTFFSLYELNLSITELLAALNARPFQKLEGSRHSLFETIDKPALKPLPPTAYEFARWKKVRVNIDCHVEINHNFYSAPYQLVRKQVDARISSTTIEIFHQGQRVGTHLISVGKGRFSTNPEHMAPKHQKYLEWTPEKLVIWAESIGPKTVELISAILSSRAHPEQGYRSCLGIMRLTKTYSKERMEAACHRALSSGACSYKSIAAILEKGLDKIAYEPQPEQASFIHHHNIRGPEYYREEDN